MSTVGTPSGTALAMINAFIEDTCVITTLGFLLVRGRVLDWFKEPDLHWVPSGVVMGAIALTEALAPGARQPYEMHTLAIALSFALLGIRSGAVATLLGVVGSALILGPSDPTWFGLLVSGCAVGVASLRQGSWWWRLPLLGALGPLVGFGAIRTTFPSWAFTWNFVHSIWANAFGMVIFGFVVREAIERSLTNDLRLQRDEADRLAQLAQLGMLRARIHPHFLFNALNTVAALCQIDANRAQRATLRLSQLMRRALEHDPRQPVALSRELEHVRSYLEIEKERFGARLGIKYRTEAEESLSLPPFAVQALVENAIIHGLSKRPKGGHVCIATRNRKAGIVVCVGDNGLGTNKGWRRDGEVHGMGILDDQLRMQYGERSRLRFYSCPDRGTLVAFFVPKGREVVE